MGSDAQSEDETRMSQALSIRLSEEQTRFLESVKPLDVGYPQNMLGETPGVTGHEGMALAAAGKIAFVRYPRAIGYE